MSEQILTGPEPLVHPESVHNEEFGQVDSKSYVTAKDIDNHAVECWAKNGSGITYSSLVQSGLARSKKHAQRSLKHFKDNKVLFTIDSERTKPQHYYPSSLKAGILKAKSVQVGHTEVDHPYTSPDQSVVDTCLRQLPSAPIFIHKMNFKVTLPKECFDELKLPLSGSAKHWECIVDSHLVRFYLNPNGTLMIYTQSSEHPHRLETWPDYDLLIAFIGQIRDRVLLQLSDIHSSIVPPILQWILVECDVNKDIPIAPTPELLHLQFHAQLSTVTHVFRLYIKAIGPETVLRAEASLTPKKPVPDALQEIFTMEGISKRLAVFEEKLERLEASQSKENSAS